MTSITEATTQSCPQCNAMIPVIPGYITWCDQCNWNLIPQKRQQRQSIFRTLSDKLGEWQSNFLLSRLLRAKNVSRQIFLTTVLAYGAASVVHLFPVAVAVVGVWILYYAFTVLAIPLNLVGTLVGLALLLMAWQTRPQFPSLPSTINPEKYPQLYQLVAQISDELKLPPIHGIAPTSSFSTYVGEYTWRQWRILFLGLPLWDVLGPQERIALLATTLARGGTNENNRAYSLYLGINNALHIASYLTPVLLFIFFVLLWGQTDNTSANSLSCCYGFWLLLLSMYALLAMDAQRTTYLAYYRGAGISGTEAQIKLVQKLYLTNNWRHALHRYAMDRNNRAKSFFATVRQEIEQIHPRELERLKRVIESELTRLDAFYPPLQQLMMFLWEHLSETPQITVHFLRWEQIDKEVARLEENLQETIALNLWGV
ncbi:MAG: M48 family metallopeptidase [Chloroflexi bacterium]|nr:M48 family metallopeptidase [Chloroflexota bacterium]